MNGSSQKGTCDVHCQHLIAYAGKNLNSKKFWLQDCQKLSIAKVNKIKDAIRIDAGKLTEKNCFM